jgi:hypothetical protein
MPMKIKHPNEDIAVVVLPDATGKAYAAADRRKIQRLVRTSVVPKGGEPYHKAQVAVKHASDGSPKALVVTLLRAHTYTADVVQVTVDGDYNVKSIKPVTTGG